MTFLGHNEFTSAVAVDAADLLITMDIEFNVWIRYSNKAVVYSYKCPSSNLYNRSAKRLNVF